VPDDPIFSDVRKHDENTVINTKTPVWGILTEPLRGTLMKGSGSVDGF
jgi:hypothetical protein